MTLLKIERSFLARPEHSNRKYVIAGNMIEEYKYDSPQPYHLLSMQMKSKGEGLKRDITPEQEKEIQLRSGTRAKQELRRLVDANHKQWKSSDGRQERQKFITLTFTENMQDLLKANSLFTDFIKRLNYFLTKSKTNQLKYVAVHELQKRGAIHYHIIFFNLPYVRNDRLEKIWGHGFTKPKVISSIKNIGNYMAKYLTKQDHTAREKHQKRYFASRGLKKPFKVRKQETVSEIAYILKNQAPTYSVRPESSIVPFEYRTYDLSNAPQVRREVLECLQYPTS
jgi:predicted metal-dependent hydrolase